MADNRKKERKEVVQAVVGINVILTNHSHDRISERLGLSKRIHQKNADKAFEEGLHISDTKGSLKKYLNKLYIKEGNANNIRVTKRYVYLFSGRVLITVLPLPHEFNKLVDKLLDKKKGENL